MDTFLREHPGQLPEVYVLNNNNVDEIAKRSDEYRKALLGI